MEDAMSEEAREDAVLVPSPDVVARRIAGEFLLVPVRSGAAQMDFIFTVNEVGSAVFDLLDGRRDARAVAAEVSRAFGVDAMLALRDVTAFLGELATAGLVRPAGRP
jgi:hypothetical protein